MFGVERYTDTCLYVYRNVCKLGVVALVKLIYKIKRQALYLLNLLRIGDTKNKLEMCIRDSPYRLHRR